MRPPLLYLLRFALLIASIGLAMSATRHHAGAQLATADPSALPGGLERAFTARVVEIVDGDTVRLDDGSEVRLIGLQAPKLALGRPGFVDWPLAEEARTLLADLVDGRLVTVAHGGLSVDRYERRLGHLERDDGLWVQGAMLAAGMARVYTFPDNRAAIAEMLALERQARAAGLGIWAEPFYAILDQAEVERRHTDTYQIVRGTVLAVERAGGRVYLNFGRDFRTDFTLSADSDHLASFEAAGLDLFALEGVEIQARGWIDWRNGPMIDLTHPELIERLD
ncbi:MAG: thermonuclease family protein [Azospirillaceae bacterium]